MLLLVLGGGGPHFFIRGGDTEGAGGRKFEMEACDLGLERRPSCRLPGRGRMQPMPDARNRHKRVHNKSRRAPFRRSGAKKSGDEKTPAGGVDAENKRDGGGGEKTGTNEANSGSEEERKTQLPLMPI